MTRTVVDNATKQRLHVPGEVLEVCDEAGRTLGFFHPVCEESPADGGTRSPLTREELARRKEQRTGRPLQEILKELEQQ